MSNNTAPRRRHQRETRISAGVQFQAQVFQPTSHPSGGESSSMP
jgi:hypothetical protein